MGDVLLSSAFLAYAGKKTLNSGIYQVFFTASRNILLGLRDNQTNACLAIIEENTTVDKYVYQN